MEFPLDIIYENSSLAQALLQKDFKFGPGGEYQDFGLNFLLVLLSLIQGSFLKECSCKTDLVVALEPKHGKIVFTLLYAVVAIYVQLTFLNIWDPRFESPLQELL